MYQMVYFDGFLATNLSDMGIKDDMMGYVFASVVITYLPLCVIFPIFCETFPRKLMFVIAMTGFGIAALLMGPSLML